MIDLPDWLKDGKPRLLDITVDATNMRLRKCPVLVTGNTIRPAPTEMLAPAQPAVRKGWLRRG
jgi:hypothetical protein